MDRPLLRVFQRQVALQCEAVLIAAEQLEQALRAYQPPLDRPSAISAWVAIQNMLTAAGNLSKALWGAHGGRHAAVREPLRVSLGIDEDSPFKSVIVRNHFEHYDERVDRWWRESPDHTHVDLGIAFGVSPQMITQSPLNQFRILDTTTSQIVFWGDRFDLRAIAREAERVLPIARAEGDRL